MFKKFNFKLKLLCICAFMALVSVGISFVSFNGLSRVSTTYKRVTNVALPNLQALKRYFRKLWIGDKKSIAA